MIGAFTELEGTPLSDKPRTRSCILTLVWSWCVDRTAWHRSPPPADRGLLKAMPRFPLPQRPILARGDLRSCFGAHAHTWPKVKFGLGLGLVDGSWVGRLGALGGRRDIIALTVNGMNASGKSSITEKRNEGRFCRGRISVACDCRMQRSSFFSTDYCQTMAPSSQCRAELI